MGLFDQYYGSSYGHNGFGNAVNGFDGMGTVAIISVILAIIAAIALAMYYNSTGYGKRMKGAGRTLYRVVNFDIYLVPFIVRFLYLLFTIFAMVMGVYMMFQESFLAGLLEIVCGVVLVRLIFEAIYLIFSFRELLYKISKNTADTAAAVPESGPETAKAPQADITECPSCGASVKPGQAFCVNCGRKLN